MPRRRVALLLSALALAACGDDGDDGGPEEAAPAEASTIPPEDGAGVDPDVPLAFELTGSTERPGPGDPEAAGSGTLDIRRASGELCFDYSLEGTSEPTMAHVHEGTPEEAGPVVVPLDPPVDGTASGCATADAALLQRVVDDSARFYVNVHTADFPDGAARGNLG